MPTARALTWAEWRASVRLARYPAVRLLVAEVAEAEVHPAGSATLRGWIGELWAALDDANLGEIDRLLDVIRRKLALERGWAEGSRRRT